MTKNPKTFRKSEKNVSGGRKAIPIRFIKVNLINIETLNLIDVFQVNLYVLENNKLDHSLRNFWDGIWY